MTRGLKGRREGQKIEFLLAGVKLHIVIFPMTWDLYRYDFLEILMGHY
jgi:hypothetical protein